jgi:DNA (cytosine-5)-methyltransferase 1
VIIDTKQVGDPRVYTKYAPTLLSNDFKEPKMVMITDDFQSTYQDTWIKGESNGMKVNSFFCGAGGFDLGFIQAGFDIAGAWDFDKYAVQSYKHNIGDHVQQADVSKMKGTDISKVNGWLFGFPCQDISVAGKQAGMIKGETRSGLFYEIMRLLGEVSDKPEWILAENVKAVKKFIPTIEEEYDKAGYTLVDPQLYNSKYWNVPQNRERYFLFGIRKDLNKSFVFPEQQTDFIPKLSSVLESDVDEKFLISDALLERFEQNFKTFKTMNGDMRIIGTTKNKDAPGTNSRHWVHDTDYRAGAVAATDYKQPKQIIIQEAMKKGYAEASEGDAININYLNSKTRRGRIGKQVAQTLLTGQEQIVYQNENPLIVRKLTPREYARLQGFPESYEQVVSDNQFYKQMGNAVTVNVSHAIAKAIKEQFE